MGTLSLTDLKDEVRTGLANRTDQDTRLTRIINIAQNRIGRIRRWKELESILSISLVNSGVLATDRRIAVTSTVRDYYSILRTDTGTSTENFKLRYIPHRDWDKRHPYPEDTTRNRPVEYTHWAKFLEFWPIQDKSYTMRARVSLWPADLSDASPNAVSDLDHKDDIIIAGALSYTFTLLRMMDDASRWFAIYKDLLNAAIDEEREKPDLDRLPTVGQSIGSSPGQYWLDPFQQVAP